MSAIYGTREQARKLWMFVLARQPYMIKYLNTKVCTGMGGTPNVSNQYRVGTLPSIMEAWLLVHCAGKSEFAWLLVQIRRKYRRMNQGNHVTIYSDVE